MDTPRTRQNICRETERAWATRTFSIRARFCWTAATAADTALLPTRPPSPPMLRRKGAMVSSFTASAGKSPAEPKPLSFIAAPSSPDGPAHRNKSRGRRRGGQRSIGERERVRSLCARSWGHLMAIRPGARPWPWPRGPPSFGVRSSNAAPQCRGGEGAGKGKGSVSRCSRDVPAASSSGRPVCSWIMSNSDAKLYIPYVSETGWGCQLGSGMLASTRGWGRPAPPSSHSRDYCYRRGVGRNRDAVPCLGDCPSGQR